jgi:hypothetical protein
MEGDGGIYHCLRRLRLKKSPEIPLERGPMNLILART